MLLNEFVEYSKDQNSLAVIYRHDIYNAKLHKETTEWNMLLKPHSFAMWLWIFGGAYRKQFFIGIPSEHKLKRFQRLCQLQVILSNFYLHHEAWFHWAISTGRASLNHSVLAFPPVKLNKVPPVPVWAWFKQLSGPKDTLSNWRTKKMWKIIRDHSKQWYLWNNKFFSDNVYKQNIVKLNTSAVT